MSGARRYFEGGARSLAPLPRHVYVFLHCFLDVAVLAISLSLFKERGSFESDRKVKLESETSLTEEREKGKTSITQDYEPSLSNNVFPFRHICIRKARSGHQFYFVGKWKGGHLKPLWRDADEGGSSRILKRSMLSGLAIGREHFTMETRLPPWSLESSLSACPTSLPPFVLRQSILGYHFSLQWHVVTHPLSRQGTA